MDRRIYIVLAAGALIAGVCIYRVQTNRPMDYSAQVQADTTYLPAPAFDGVDENNEMFRLTSYLGRHRIIVVFYDGGAGAERSRELIGLRDRADELKRQDVKVVAVSTAIPQENRRSLQALGPLAFPMISDVDQSIHQKWGRMSLDGKPLPGLFLIDRKGTVAFRAGSPRSYDSLDDLWKDVQR